MAESRKRAFVPFCNVPGTLRKIDALQLFIVINGGVADIPMHFDDNEDALDHEAALEGRWQLAYFPDREKLTLLDAIRLAVGYTHGANPARVIVKGVVDGQEKVFRVNAKAKANGEAATFEVVRGDLVTVAKSRL